MVDIELVFPPSWDASTPFISIPSLVAYLKEKGHDVHQIDANIILRENILTKKYLDKTLLLLQDKINKNECSKEKLNQLVISEKILDTIINEVEDAKKSIRNRKEEFDVEKEIRNKNILDQAMGINFASHDQISLQAKSYPTILSIDTILDQVKTENTYTEPLKEFILPIIKKKNPKVVGISFAGKRQLIPGFTLAKIIKENIDNVFIVIGGPVISFFQEQIKNSRNLFSIIDGAVVGEGEIALDLLLENFDNKGFYNKIPNFIFLQNEQIIKSNIRKIEEINNLPPPDYSDLDLSAYFAKDTVLPILTSRGCYWNRCAFCTINTSYCNKYHERKVELVIEDLSYLNRKYNCKFFFFNDEAISPNRLAALSKGICEKNLDINWLFLSRLERNHSEKIFKLAKKAGCKLISWGLESGSQKVLDSMNKGINIKDVGRILKESSSMGIWNHVFVTFGFPTEKINDANDSINFICNNRNFINSLIYTPFRLEKGSDVFNNPQKYFIITKEKDPNDLNIEYEYIAENGINQERIKYLVKDIDSFFAGTHLSMDFDYDQSTCLSALGYIGKKEFFGYLHESKFDKIKRGLETFGFERTKIKLDDNIELIELKEFKNAILYKKNIGKFLTLNQTGIQIINELKNNECNQMQLYKKFIETFPNENQKAIEADINNFLRLLISSNFIIST